MRRLHVFLPALGLCLWTDVALANAGGYVFGVKFTGSLAPFQASGTECVRIVEENLDIDLRRTDASVVVRYTMRNFAESPMSVRFGFPVEANPRDESWEDEQYQRNARPKAFRSPIPQLKEYRVTANGNPVKAKFGIEPFATGKIKPFPGSAALKNIAGWMVSNVTFPAAASLTLEIRYAADYLGSSTFWATKTESTPLTFVYRLSTGAVWNGPIEKGTVTVRADGIPTAEVEIVAPRGRFRRDGDRWVWSFRDLEPTLADDIAIRAIPGHFEQFADPPRPGDWSHLEREGKRGEGHQRFRATASSTLAPTKDHGFGPEHLSELMPVAPWAEGVVGPGIGQWVEFEPTNPRPLLALGIWPGFQSFNNPARFEQNGRPSRVEIVLNGEHRFIATLGDRPEGQLIPVLDYAKPVSKLRITIREVFPGTRLTDTCISRVVLYDDADEKSEIQEGR